MRGQTSTAKRWSSHAFGLALNSSFPLAGCPETTPSRDLPIVRIDIADASALRRSVPRDSAMISWDYASDGGRIPGFLAHPRGGYRVDTPAFGTFHISRAGGRIRCAPTTAAPWQWQRYLLAQVLPFASTLRGFEPWHASAVAIADRAIAFAGDSGMGKSSLAAAVILRGGRLLADDVIALERTDRGAVVHPGPGLMSLRTTTASRLGDALWEIGRRVGADDRSIRLAVARHEEPLPLSAVYLLEPARSPKRPLIERESTPDPRRLLGSTFNFALRTASRLATQLDVCAVIARSVRVARVSVPIDCDLQELSQRLIDDSAGDPKGAR